MAFRVFALATGVVGVIVTGAPPSHAAPPAAEEFDDPKLSREGLAPAPSPRVVAAPSSEAPGKGGPAEKTVPDKMATPTATPGAEQVPAAASGVSDQRAAAKPAGAKAGPDEPAAAKSADVKSGASQELGDRKLSAPKSPGSAAPAGGAADVKAVAAPPAAAPESPAAGPWPYVPRLKLAYRRFPFSRIMAVTADGVMTSPTSESFESLSIDTYPMSSYLRVGLSTQFGWESGQFNRTGDYFIAESASVGFQIPGRYTPFVETLAGAGYMRRRQTDSNLPTAYWQVGVDVGVELYFAKRAYGSIAIGYLHPANLFFAQRNLQSVNLDTWSLKVGLGI
jgi:hypothetical protein